jgi:hypothetical protein
MVENANRGPFPGNYKCGQISAGILTVSVSVPAFHFVWLGLSGLQLPVLVLSGFPFRIQAGLLALAFLAAIALTVAGIAVSS